jgi:hypothetical protein
MMRRSDKVESALRALETREPGYPAYDSVNGDAAIVRHYISRLEALASSNEHTIASLVELGK